MKKSEDRLEYDFRRGTRARHVQAAVESGNLRTLDADLAERFPDSASVNRALRRVAPTPSPKRKKSASR